MQFSFSLYFVTLHVILKTVGAGCIIIIIIIICSLFQVQCMFFNFLIFFQVRDPMPAVYFFLIDVSLNAIQTGATAAACSAIGQVISDLPVSMSN